MYEYFTLHPLFAAEEAQAYPHLLLLHSMTKRYAIPGLRLGYVTGNARMLERLRNLLVQTGVAEVWDTKTLLKEHGMLIRDASNFSGLDERYFRIAAQGPEENNRLAAAMTQWAEES